MVHIVFARLCATERAKFKNWPMSRHSPGEAACPKAGLFIDSHAQKGILRANRGGGGVEHHCEGIGGRSEVAAWAEKVMDDVELWPFFLF